MKESREYPTRPFVGAGAIVIRGRKVLLVRRRFPPNEGRWALPGGLVELGESVQDAVVREVQEETGLTVKLEGLFEVGTDLHLDAKSRPRYHFVLVDYLARPAGGKVRLNDESSSYGWFSSQDIARLEMSRGTRDVLGLYFSRLPSKTLGSARRPQGKRSS